VGVSLPGVVHRTTGRLAVAPNLGWSDVALRDILGGVVPDGVGVELGNDADLSLLAEHQRGSARGYDDVVFVMGRVGVGAGVISAGVPVHGRDGYAGEIGHNVLDPQGPPCHCGKRGCIEVYVGENALLALAGRRGPRTDAAVEALFADARAGDDAARRAIDAVVEPLGRTVATLLNTLNPARVVLGGSLSEVLALARPALEEAVGRYAFALPDEVSVVAPTLGGDSALLGAAEIAFASLLADPR
jgi:predicted NBD/HSP70 family sugar kinase